MANLQESFIANANLGRGLCNYITNTVFGCLALSSSGTFNVAIGEKASCSLGDSYRSSIGYNAGMDAGGHTINIGAGLTQYCVSSGIQIGHNTCSRYFGHIIIGASAGGCFGCYIGPFGGTFQALIGTNSGRNISCGGYGPGGGRKVNIMIGSSAGYCSTEGRYNTFIGYSAGFCVTTGDQNIAIGEFAGCGITTAAVTISIGSGGSPSNTNCHTIIGNASSTDGWIYPAQWDTPSDCRDKTNVETLPNNLGLNFIRKLRPVSFKWDRRQEYVNKCEFEYGQKDGTLTHSQKKYGFIAQEIKTAIEELNATFEGLGYDSEKDIYQLQQYSLVPSIIKAIQETDDRLTLLEQQLSN